MLIDERIKARAKEIIDHAKANIMPLKTVMELAKQVRLNNGYPNSYVPVGDNPKHVIRIPHGFRAVFSFEQHPEGLVAHLSVSYRKAGAMPNPHHVEAIMNLFDFENEMYDCTIGFEPISDKRNAVNILEVRNEI